MARKEKAEQLEAAGKRAVGGLHKFDAEEVDVHGGSATADDFLDAFGFDDVGEAPAATPAPAAPPPAAKPAAKPAATKAKPASFSRVWARTANKETETGETELAGSKQTGKTEPNFGLLCFVDWPAGRRAY